MLGISAINRVSLKKNSRLGLRLADGALDEGTIMRELLNGLLTFITFEGLRDRGFEGTETLYLLKLLLYLPF